jgi:hypothetical protein
VTHSKIGRRYAQNMTDMKSPWIIRGGKKSPPKTVHSLPELHYHEQYRGVSWLGWTLGNTKLICTVITCNIWVGNGGAIMAEFFLECRIR